MDSNVKQERSKQYSTFFVSKFLLWPGKNARLGANHPSEHVPKMLPKPPTPPSKGFLSVIREGVFPYDVHVPHVFFSLYRLNQESLLQKPRAHSYIFSKPLTIIPYLPPPRAMPGRFQFLPNNQEWRLTSRGGQHPFLAKKETGAWVAHL